MTEATPVEASTPPQEPAEGTAQITPPADGGEAQVLLGGREPEAPVPFDLEKFEVPEGLELSDEHKKFLAEVAKEHNLPMKAVEAFVGKHAAELKAVSDGVRQQVQQKWDETLEGWKTETTKAYGDKLDGVLKKCEAVIDEYGGKEFYEVLKTTGLGNNLAVIRMFEKLSNAVGEPAPVSTGGHPADVHPLAKMYPTMVDKV